jgi:DNA-binding transcriptional ArsR family regulator
MPTEPVQLLKALGDETRLRIVRLLFREELNVLELGQILDVPQPSVSRHLSALKRPVWFPIVGKVRRCSTASLTHTEGLSSLEGVIRELAMTDHPDLIRLENVVAARAKAAHSLMDEKADQWDEIVGMLHNSAASLLALAHMAPRGMTIADLGTGTGLLLPLLSPMAAEVHALDRSAAMLRRARSRCRQAELRNIFFHQAELTDLPDDLPLCDVVMLHFVLHQIASPGPPSNGWRLS